MRYTAPVLSVLASALCAGALAPQGQQAAMAAPAPAPPACAPEPQLPAPLINDNSLFRTGNYIVGSRAGVDDVFTRAQARMQTKGQFQLKGPPVPRGPNRFVVRLAGASKEAKDALRETCGVLSVEAELRGTYDAAQGSPPPRGLDRIDQRGPALDGGTSMLKGNDSIVHVYVIDSGIDTTNREFGTRASTGPHFSVVTDQRDCNGHGTAVAAVVGGNTFGVAKNVQLHSVRVSDENCLLLPENMKKGVDWVRQNVVTPAVVTMSVSIPGRDTDLDEAVKDLIEMTRVTFVNSAGNRHENACSFSPGGGALKSITVGAVQSEAVAASGASFDTEPTFTNFGWCVDLFAPGVDIETAIANGVGQLCPDMGTHGGMLCQGTSFAAGLVSGCAALFLQSNRQANEDQVWGWLIGRASHWEEDGSPLNTKGFDGIKSPESVKPEQPNPAPTNFWHYGTPNTLLYCGT